MLEKYLDFKIFSCGPNRFYAFIRNGVSIKYIKQDYTCSQPTHGASEYCFKSLHEVKFAIDEYKGNNIVEQDGYEFKRNIDGSFNYKAFPSMGRFQTLTEGINAIERITDRYKAFPVKLKYEKENYFYDFETRDMSQPISESQKQIRPSKFKPVLKVVFDAIVIAGSTWYILS